MSQISYKDAGVDIDAGNSFVENIKPLVKSTKIPGVLGGIGSFAGAFELQKDMMSLLCLQQLMA